MLSLKDQLDKAVANMLVANITDKEYSIDVDYTYRTNERVVCLDCEQGEANLITENKVILVKLKDGDVLHIDEYIVMNPYEQTAWDTLYANGFLSHLYEKRDVNDDDVVDTLFRLDTVTDKYFEVSGKKYVIKEDIYDAIAEGTFDQESLKDVTVITRAQFESLSTVVDDTEEQGRINTGRPGDMVKINLPFQGVK